MTEQKTTKAEQVAREVARLQMLALVRDIDRIEKRAAASRALGLANKLKNPESRKKHKARIFSALNKLRAG